MIDIIIPAYNAHDYLSRALNSILMQSIHDKIKVYIIDDCSDKNYNDIVKKYKNNLYIKVYRTKKNKGPGYARQYGIDNSSSDYIMFLDADDILFNCFTVENLYKFINDNKYNVVNSNFIEETANNQFFHCNDTIWLHGKIYRRKFLQKNKIRFTNTYSNEDVYFNKLIYILTDIYYLDSYTYVWKYNKESITRRNNHEYNFKGINGYIDNVYEAIKEAKKRKANEYKILIVLFETLIELYFKYLKYYKIDKENIIVNETRKLINIYQEFENKKYEIIKEDVFNMMLNRKREYGGIELLISANISFNEFLNEIKS